MKATTDTTNLRNTPISNEVFDPIKADASKALAAACVDYPRGNAPLLLIKKLREAELLAFLTNEDISKGKKLAEIARQHDPELLITIALGTAPISIRKSALVRIDEICDGDPLDHRLVGRLIPCLGHKELIATTIVLMDVSDFDWSPHFNEAMVDALCGALYECQVIHESVILEDVFTHLAHRRHDLYQSLRGCDPGKFLMRTAYAPVTTDNIIFVDLPKKGNVA